MPERRKAKGPNPMDEENFPTDNPTRRAVDREMREPSNIRGPAEPIPRRKPPIHEAGDEDGRPSED